MHTTLTLAHPWALLLLPVAIVFLGLVWKREKERRAVLRIPSFSALKSAPRGLAALGSLPKFLHFVAVVLVVLCLARPQSVGQYSRDVTVEGIDIVVALDVSASMLAADFKPRDRLTVAKQVLNTFIEGRPNDRIGLVVFAGEAYTQAPLTFDHRVLTQIMDSIQTGLIEDGTAIGNALATSLNRLRDSEAKSRVVILITDGDNNAGNISPTEAAKIAKELGIKVFPILVGKGGKVPFPSGRDFFGKTIYKDVDLPVNPELLESIAQTADGAFYRALDRRGLERGLNDILDKLDKTVIDEGGTYQNRSELFGPLMLLALIVLFLEILLTTTRMRSFP